ncbi:hypothetical protein [Marinobacter zhejiangensis]|uniref:Secreted protein n=1 Tax=Marinobacter zhejiangensis TaxID=488535 RepID=A0A1I4RQX7_9GAMM|nr:hypothetical protein [Marinobacter zhejiangensis]SFM54586.1 hypothetical protein SAMN04487963_2897 [Marinobacter zhejiangensis]
MTAKQLALLAMLALGAALVSADPVVDEDDAGGGETVSALTVEGISAQPGDDDPRVLYILPWQAPTIPRRPRSELSSEMPELMTPIDPVVFERHRNFRETLNPELDSIYTPN